MSFVHHFVFVRLSLNLYVCQFLSIHVHFCSFLSISVHSCPFLSIPVHFLSISVYFCLFLSISVYLPTFFFVTSVLCIYFSFCQSVILSVPLSARPCFRLYICPSVCPKILHKNYETIL